MSLTAPRREARAPCSNFAAALSRPRRLSVATHTFLQHSGRAAASLARIGAGAEEAVVYVDLVDAPPLSKGTAGTADPSSIQTPAAALLQASPWPDLYAGDWRYMYGAALHNNQVAATNRRMVS